MFRPRLTLPAALAAALLSITVAHGQTTQSFGANHDNTLYGNLDVDVSNGAGTSMFSGVPNNGLVYRAIMSFDVSAIPAGATITGASLQLHMVQTIDNTPRAYALHRTLASWGEGTSNATVGGGGIGADATSGDATWRYRFFNIDNPLTSTPWTNLGGDFDPAASATTLVGGVGFYTWSSAGLIADLQAWIDKPSANFGWVLTGDESTMPTARRFDTREATNAAFRPKLTVTWVIPAPGAATGLAAAGLLALRRSRRS